MTLEWDPATNSVQVRYQDHRSPTESFACPVDPEDARGAFLHPFALRASSRRSGKLADRPKASEVGAGRKRRWFRKRSRPEAADGAGGQGWARWLQDASAHSSDYSWLWWPPEDEGG